MNYTFLTLGSETGCYREQKFEIAVCLAKLGGWVGNSKGAILAGDDVRSHNSHIELLLPYEIRPIEFSD